MSAPAEYRHEPTMPPLRLWRRWVRTVLTMLVISVSIAATTCPECWRDGHRMLINFVMTTAYTFGLWITNGYAVDWLDRYVNWKREPLKRLLLTIVVSLGGSLLVIIAINFCFLVLYRGYSPAEMWAPGAWMRYVFPLLFTSIISLVLHSRSFLLGWREAVVRNERLQKEMAQAEAETLRQQLDPHFMFNALNALTSLVEEEPQLAVRFIRQLSQVYRYVLDARGRDVVPLAEELEFAESYLFLQRIRYGEALQAELPAPESVPPQAVVPPLSLQLLLENALKHNAASASQPLHLRIELDESGQHLRVRNTLRARRLAPDESTGIGLHNLTARYRHLTQEPVLIARDEQEFVVTLPVLELVV
ncbi:hypothetical protein F0P96_17575 [Hymenobacter busanensis]|uniref:Signal transduction histidine kinase internal region domain-containing protein n=1 Tax=Hymenobacter busanensis TaxID=2607656 RepID=A0A7L5A454_9BACT|nr:histidine kinase [Hymenobacter busanensis]KAA9327051.1 hypothetical protein F0P96_17575 [Hymenobacter busanensis]QHJ09502.1 hypothetical protein GUY19_20390 [Hymenobacter busanensis]